MSERRIDRFIEAMHRKEAESLVFGTGFPVRLRKDGLERVILDQPVKSQQILALLGPIGGDFEDSEGEFVYEAPSGPVAVRTRKRGDQLSAIIMPYQAPPEPEPALEGQDEAMEELMGNEAPEVAPPPPSVFAVPEPEPEPVHAEPEPAPQIELAAGEAAINRILRQLVAEGGSDLHMTATQPPMYRHDGEMKRLRGWEPLSSETIDQWMRQVAHEAARDTFDETYDADFAHEIPGISRFRMNWFRDRLGVSAVMRTIPSKILTAEQLGLPSIIRSFCELPKGLVVVTGPTGSGKSTTLAAMVDFINKSRSDHIITIEDPVEFVHKSARCLVNQREVHSHTKSFSAALRAALREDPDIVLVGEMRDLETVHIAIETAETGHLVFGTLHTNTAASTVDRIIDQFPTDHQSQIRVMLSESLKGVVAQTLCKKVGGGRVACLEILAVNNAISNLIREGKTFQIPSIMQTNKGMGMQTQSDHMLELVKTGQVEPLEAYRKAVDQGTMKQVLERNGFTIDAA
ncbi:MAG: type IV pilus twitching motility protein PilT [Myxococcota bacterium]